MSKEQKITEKELKTITEQQGKIQAVIFET